MLYSAYLTILSGHASSGRVGPLTSVTSMGRKPANTVVLGNDRLVSGLHAEIRQTPEGGYVLEDRMSANGTWVGGRDIKTQAHALRHGDVFEIGSTRMRFDLVPEDDVIHSVPLASAAPVSAETVTILGVPGAAGPLALLLDRDSAVDIKSPSSAYSSGIFLPAQQINDADQLRRDYDKLRMAHSILAAVSRPMPLAKTLRAIATKAFESLAAQRFAVLLVADESGALEERLVLDRNERAPDDAVPVSRTLLARVLAGGRPLLARDVAKISSVADAPSIMQAAIRSVVCAPIIENDQLFGVLYADNAAPHAPFDEKDLLVLSTIANQLAMALTNARLAVEVREEARRRAVLGRFLSPNLVNEVLAGRLSLSPAGETRTVAVMFTDIRGFTTISEKLPAREVTALLNEHFDVLIDVLFRFNGTLDKFVGDCLMAVFGAPTTGAADAETAVRCGLEMQAAITRLNAARRLRGADPVAIGVGINYGEVSWGPIGSRDMMGYTVVGDVVNLASRLCGKAGAGEVIVSSSVKERLPAAMRTTSRGLTEVKGKMIKVETYKVEPA